MTPLKVYVPNHHFNAVNYSFGCLLTEFLGVEIEMINSDSHADFVIQHEKKTLTILNAFFYIESKEDLFSKENIPDNVDDETIEFEGNEFPILSIYGKSSLTYEDQNHIRLESDIIASTFFMLSRWEEAIIEKRDAHDRFDYRSSLSVRKGFYQRPIVNEYVELLWAICRFLNPYLKRKQRKYFCTVTSDIDQLRKWKKPKRLLESIYLHVTAGKLDLVFKDIGNYVRSQFNPKKDFFNNLDYLAEQSGGLKTIFYLKTNYSHPKHDKNRYDPQDYLDEFREVKEQGVKFGIHPHYNAYLNQEDLLEEVENLISFKGGAVNLVRQHYLRFSVPETWKYQAEAGLKEDSTMIYPHLGGFRNGVCYPFPVFDFEGDCKLDLYESPLILMETAYLSSGFDQLLADAEKLISIVRKYNGNFVFLWHNGNLVYQEQRFNFEKLIELAR